MASEKSSQSTVGWWLGWILLTIVSFFVSCYFWTKFIAAHVGRMQDPGVPILWVAAVFGTWMVLLVPLIIVMYHKVDKAYEDARIARETAAFEKAKNAFRVKSILVADSDRLLSKSLSQKLKKIPETIKHGHLVTAVLRDGRKIENVFIRDKKDVLGVYGVDSLPFRIRDIVDLETTAFDCLPDFKAEKWLRLDGIGGSP